MYLRIYAERPPQKENKYENNNEQNDNEIMKEEEKRRIYTCMHSTTHIHSLHTYYMTKWLHASTALSNEATKIK